MVARPRYFGIPSCSPWNFLRDPKKYGKKVKELSFEEYKPWEIAKHLPLPANFTISYRSAEKKVEIWSIFPALVEKAIKKSLAKQK